MTSFCQESVKRFPAIAYRSRRLRKTGGALGRATHVTESALPNQVHTSPCVFAPARTSSRPVGLGYGTDALGRKRALRRSSAKTLDQQRDGSILINPRPLPNAPRSGILPEGLLDRIERQTIHFPQHARKLLAPGRHLRRGVLLYGAPGTGKTLTAMYLASAMAGRTVLVVTGRGVGVIEGVGVLARSLQPSTVIIEDVDLIAEERSRNSPGCNGVLFELLNEMDGLANDADILFLTTNRAEMLEPALASRPGRVDLAIEIPVPDAESRQRLFDPYRQGLRFEVRDLDTIVERTEGVSAAFIRELVRKAALAAADEGEELVVEDRHLEEALHELLIEGGALTPSLLGAKSTDRAA